MSCRLVRRHQRLVATAAKLIGLSVAIALVWHTLSGKPVAKPLAKPPAISHLNASESKTLDQNIRKSIEDLRKSIESMNEKQNVLNSDLFAPLGNNDLVLVVQVHNRIHYLSALIRSLERTEGIGQTLVVFSHDVFDPQINSLVNAIKFCKVIQIFYPYSLQLHPNTFPGQSPEDCPRDVSPDEAAKMGCINAKSADSYGHYREASVCQTKHHWWWKTNQVFDKLRVTAHHSGPVMFLEEDHYLSADAIHVWKLMNEINRRDENKHPVITLGSYTRSPDFARNGNKVLATKWMSSEHNMGFAIDRAVWSRVKACAQTFCRFDDYNWDWTLQHVSDHCLPQPLTTLVVSTPRVYHTGGCGLHHKKTKCNNEEVIAKLEKLFESSHNYLFPKQMTISESKKSRRAPKPNGGWADPRDHSLCLKNS